MKELTISFSDEEYELLEEQFEILKSRGIELKSIADCVAYSALTHCRTMKVACSMLGMEDIEELIPEKSIPIGVVPVSLNGDVDKDEFGEYLTEVLNAAIDDFNNNNNGPIN